MAKSESNNKPNSDGGKTRVDKWLWAARLFKTRGAASDACKGGHTKINGSTVGAGKAIKLGDMVDVFTAGGRRVYEVIAIADRRRSAKEAALLFTDHTPPEPPGPKPLYARTGPRPTKRDRRKMERERGR